MSKNKKPTQNKKGTSNLKSIKDIPESYKTKAELEKHIGDLIIMIDGQNRHIQKLETDLEQANQKVRHLEKILENSVPKLGEGDSIQLDEVTIARMQLQKLGRLAANRELTNEEARRFEIFSRVIQNDAKIDKQKSQETSFRDVSPTKLLEMATAKPKKD